MAAAATPPYSITPEILSLVEQIGEAIGQAEAASSGLDIKLRRQARVRTVHGSVAIEGNALSEEQVSAILDGRRVVGQLRDIREVRNANAAYDLRETWEPSSEAALLAAHEVLMSGLMESAGQYRAGWRGRPQSGPPHRSPSSARTEA